MTRMTVFIERKKQKALLEALLREMKIQLTVEQGKKQDETRLSESVFLAKLNQSIAQAENGQRKRLSAKDQKTFLGL